jgi:hypothetical protein
MCIECKKCGEEYFLEYCPFCLMDSVIGDF